LWIGGNAVRQSRRNAQLLAERRADEAANLLTSALVRDMQGVQQSVLLSAEWDQFMLDSPYDIETLIASAFARYPYPESFFAWRRLPSERTPVFFSRRDRPPVWMEPDASPNRFPVAVTVDARIGRPICDRIRLDAARGRRFSVFTTEVRGVPYQVVARLLYADAFREHLEAVFGFVVDLQWVRLHYFSEFAEQVARVVPSANDVTFAILDAHDRPVASTPADNEAAYARSERRLAMTFFNPSLAAVDPPPDLALETWTVRATARQAETSRSFGSTVAAGIFLLGLALAVAAFRTRTNLNELRADFVAGVTHELKTPIATIRAIGESLRTGRAANPSEYAGLVVQEAKRLTRLVDNLLAFSRVTDTAAVQSFEPIAVDVLVSDALQRLDWQLREAGFAVSVNMPRNLPPIFADPSAVTLMVDNVLDNVVRHSRTNRRLDITAAHVGAKIVLTISDAGGGIPDDELPLVTRKFYRGRHAGPGGTGLGLAIASRIATEHGGELTVRSVTGAGTTVSISLPVAAAERIA